VAIEASIVEAPAVATTQSEKNVLPHRRRLASRRGRHCRGRLHRHAKPSFAPADATTRTGLGAVGAASMSRAVRAKDEGLLEHRGHAMAAGFARC
jgi:hypothetical protein